MKLNILFNVIYFIFVILVSVFLTSNAKFVAFAQTHPCYVMIFVFQIYIFP
jgi:hypothetical protein